MAGEFAENNYLFERTENSGNGGSVVVHNVRPMPHRGAI